MITPNPEVPMRPATIRRAAALIAPVAAALAIHRATLRYRP